jgi:nitrate reductase NapAB chaperone NapD
LDSEFMKIQFEDKSYIECRKSDNPGKVIIVISAKDHENPLKKIANTVEITVDQLKGLLSDVQIQP